MSNTANENTNLTVTISEGKALSPIRDYGTLSSDEQQQVQSLIGQLHDCSETTLNKFSAASAKESAKESVDFLKSTKINDLGEFNTCMLDITRNLRLIDTKELATVNPSPSSKIPIIGSFLSKSSAGKKIDNFIEKQQTIEKVIKQEVQTLEGIKLTLSEDLIKCKKIRESTIAYAIQLELEYIALYQKRLELEKEYNEFTTSPNYNSFNLEDSEHSAELQDGIAALERKMDATLRSRINAIGDIPSYTTIRQGEQAIIYAIDDCIDNVVPEWEKSFAKALIAYRLANAATVVQKTKEATGEIYVTAAKITSKALISAAEAIETPQVATKALEEKTQIFIDTCNKLVEISNNASEARIADAEKLKEIEKETLIANQARKTAKLTANNEGGN